MKVFNTYRMVLYAGKHRVARKDFSCQEPVCFVWNAKKEVPFYRAEVWDTTLNSRIAIGNPIWNLE